MVDAKDKPTIEMLREIKLLRPFTDAELCQLISSGSSFSQEAHGNIIVEGELSWGLYLIMEGTVGIFKNDKLSGSVYDVAQLREGGFFGEMSILDDSPRSATVRAVTNCKLFYLSKQAFQQFLAVSTGIQLRFYQSCIEDLIHRLRETDDGFVVSQYQLWRFALKKESA